MSEIRLVRFVDEPNTSDLDTTPIHLQLRHASLNDSDTQYAALSYTWGEAKDLIRLYIDGSPFEIGRNLHDALMQLRRAGNTRWLWIDSICIQQSDEEEKGWQVSQMRAIYGQAEIVLIWLGLGCGETDRTMDWISRIGPRALSSGALDLWPHLRRRQDICDYIISRYSPTDERALGASVEDNQVPELARFIFDLLNERGLHSETLVPKDDEDDLTAGIINLMQRDYWHRIWIIQEVSLGKEAMVLCGSTTVPLDMFDATLTGVAYCIRSGVRRLHADIDAFARGLKANFYKSIALTTRRHYRAPDQDHRRFRLADVVYQVGIAPGRPHYSATDPRDILFGLLGVMSDEDRDIVFDLLSVMSDDDRASFEVDYRLDMSQVFSALTKALIHNGDKGIGLFHLDSCVPKDGTKQIDSLPSWVPDWRDMGKFGAGVHPVNYPPAFKATAGIPSPAPPLRCKPDDPLGLLRRRGCRVDAISEVMEPPQWHANSEWSPSTIVNAKGWLDSIRDFVKLEAESGPGEDYIWRTVLIGRPDLHKKRDPALPAHDEFACIVRKIFRAERVEPNELTEIQREYIQNGPYDLASIRPNLTTLDDQLAFLREELPQCSGTQSRGRTLFKTNKSMFGLGHVAIRAGDIVTLLAGIQSPIILRPWTVGGGGGFTFVGDAYVDGIMDGEFLKTMPAFEEFEIY